MDLREILKLYEDVKRFYEVGCGISEECVQLKSEHFSKIINQYAEKDIPITCERLCEHIEISVIIGKCKIITLL